MSLPPLKIRYALLALALLAMPAAAEDFRHSVKVHEVSRQDSYIAQRRFSGRAEAAQRSQLAFELPGKVERVAVEAGQQVEAGQVLVALDTALLDVQRSELGAALAENRAALDKVEKNLQRQRDLRRKGHSAEQTIDDLASEREVLLARRERLQAQLRGVDVRLDKSVLVAPFAGELVAKFVDAGVIVKEGQAALELVGSGRTEAVIGVPRSLRDEVEPGQHVRVRGAFGEVPATVDSVSQTVNPGTLTHSVRVSFPADTDVADGSIVYMLLQQEEPESGFWVPLSALLEGYRGTWALYALKPDEGGHLLEKHSARVIYQAGDRVFVDAALASGDRVVAAGVHRYAAGQQVRVSAND